MTRAKKEKRVRDRWLVTCPLEEIEQFWREYNEREAARKAARKSKSNRGTNEARENDMGKKTEEKPAETTTATEEATGSPEITGTRTPLALVPPPAGSTGYIAFQPIVMTKERRDFLKKQFTPTGCTDLELEYFIAFCERTGMDPVLKQAYLVERFAQVNGNWVKKFEPMVSEAGMAARADGLPDFRGMRDGLVYENDEFACDRVTQTITHKSGHPSKRGKLIGAWAHVIREGRVVPPSYFNFTEKAQYTKEGKLTKFWAYDGNGPSQLLKCARAEQWRQGWPGIFNGHFIPEEMREEIDVTPPTEAAAAEAGRDTTDKLADKARAKKSSDASGSRAQSVPPAEAVVDVIVTKPEQQLTNVPEHAKDEVKRAPVKVPTKEEIDALVVRLEKAQAPYDGERLVKDPHYFAAQVDQVTKFETMRDTLAKQSSSVPEGFEKADGAHGSPSPSQLWTTAAGDQKKYIELLKEHGHLVPKNDPAGDAVKKAAVKLAGGITSSEMDRAGPPPVDEGPLMNFGQFKTRPIKSLSGPDLLEQIAFGESKIGTLAPDKAQKVRACIDLMKARQAEIEKAMVNDVSAPAPTEPPFDVD